MVDGSKWLDKCDHGKFSSSASNSWSNLQQPSPLPQLGEPTTSETLVLGHTEDPHQVELVLLGPVIVADGRRTRGAQTNELVGFKQDVCPEDRGTHQLYLRRVEGLTFFPSPVEVRRKNA